MLGEKLWREMKHTFYTITVFPVMLVVFKIIKQKCANVPEFVHYVEVL